MLHHTRAVGRRLEGSWKRHDPASTMRVRGCDFGPSVRTTSLLAANNRVMASANRFLRNLAFLRLGFAFENGGRIGRAFAVGDVAALLGQPPQQFKKQGVDLGVLGHLLKRSGARFRHIDAIAPAQDDVFADRPIIIFSPFEQPQVLILASGACLK